MRSNPLPQSSSASRLPSFASCTLAQATDQRQLKHPGNSTIRVLSSSPRFRSRNPPPGCGCVFRPVMRISVARRKKEGERLRRFEVSMPCRALLHLLGNRMFLLPIAPSGDSITADSAVFPFLFACVDLGGVVAFL